MHKLLRRLAPAAAFALLAALVAGCGGGKTTAKAPDSDRQTGASAPADAPVPGKPQPPSEGRKPLAGAPGAAAPQAKAPAGNGALPRPGRAPGPTATPAAKVDIPVYPGAKPFTGKGSVPAAKGLKEYTTPAKFADVVKWYRSNFRGQEAPVPPEARQKMAAFRSINERNGEVRIVNIVNPGKGARIVLAQGTVPKDVAAQMKKDRGGPPELPKDIKIDRDKDKAAAQIGLPLYPGATVKDGVLMSREKMPDLRQVALRITTSDSPKKVFDWYKGQLKDEKLEEQKSEKGDAYALGYQDEAARTMFRMTAEKREEVTVVQLLKMTFPPNAAGAKPKAGS